MQQKFITLAIASALMSSTYAQDRASELDAITVDSVYAVPAQHDNTGSSVTILTTEDFKQRNATYVLDVLKTVPSIAVSQSGGRGTLSAIRLRGAESNHTQVVIDGIKVNPATGGGYDFGMLPLNTIERIEILRGEQSALWGADAIGGVINIQTKSGKKADKAFNADINLGAGSDKTADTSVSLYGRQGGLYYAISASHNRTDGISAADSNVFKYTAADGTKLITGGATEDDSFERSNGSIKVGYEGERAGIELFYRRNDATAHYDGGSSLRTEGSAFTQPETDNYSENQESLFKISGHLGNHDDLIRQTAYLSGLNHTADYHSAWGTSTTEGKKRNIGYQIDVNFDREGATTQGFSASYEYQNDNLDSFNGNNTIRQNSVAVEYRLFNDNDHSFTIGVRHDQHSKFKDETTFRVASGYRINETLRLHSSFGTGVKNPTLFELYGFGGSFRGNPNLTPEKSIGGDIGVTLNSSDNNHQLDVTYFNRRLEDIINTNPSQAYNEKGKAKSQGLELAYQGSITDNATLYANYTFNKTENNSGKELVYRPRHQANLGIDYQITEQLSTHGNIHYVGSRNGSYGWGASAQSVAMPSYTTLNMGMNYTITAAMSAYLNVNNILDEDYEATLGYGQPGRNFYLGFTGSW